VDGPVASVGYMKTEPVIDIMLFSCMFAFIAGNRARRRTHSDLTNLHRVARCHPRQACGRSIS
jgi:hypothetical protein